MKIATFNINSIKARLESFCAWLKHNTPDIVLLQEIKTESNTFPYFEIEALGYKVHAFGQKSYNGVAILSKYPIEDVVEGLPKFDDDNSRYLEATINGIRIASVYLPNGTAPYNNPDDNSKFEYKLKWMNAFYKHAKSLVDSKIPVIFGGDFNVMLTDLDVYNPKAFKNSALYREEVKQRLNAVQYLGFYDAFRVLHPDEIGYTYWDYGKAFDVDWGLRIDYFWLSPTMADKLKSCEVDKSPRIQEKPSDHTPLVMELIL